jgi:hypothetical protein
MRSSEVLSDNCAYLEHALKQYRFFTRGKYNDFSNKSVQSEIYAIEK